jgi:hypothetical protein
MTTYLFIHEHIVHWSENRISAWPENFFVPFLRHPSPKVHDWPYACLFWQKSNLTKPYRSRVEYSLGTLKIDVLEHVIPQRRKGRLCQRSPYIMAKEEYSIAVNIRFCNVEVGSNKGNYNRVKNIIYKLVKQFSSLACV